MSNYFQLLGIKPTKDKEAIKKAFIAKLMESLPINSNEQAFACHQTLSAWNFLSVPENLKAQYKYATSIFSKKDSKQEVSNSVNAQTLKVYVPVFVTDAAKDSNNPNMIAASIKTYLDGEMFKQVGLDRDEAIAIAQKDPSLKGSVAFMVVATTIQVTKLKKVSSDAIPSEHLVLDGKLSLSLEQIKDGLLAGGNKKVVEEDESAPYAAEEKKQKSFGARFVRFITGITNFFLNGLKGLKNLFTFSSKKKDDTKPAQEAVKPVATVVTDQKTGYIMSVFKSLGSKLHIISTPVVETEVQQPAPVEKTKTASQQPALDMQDEVRLTMNNSF